jgi:4'-phosphopantetheinyl transferase
MLDFPRGFSLFELSEGEVHLWCAFPDEWDEAVLNAAARRLLDAGEIARMERIRPAEGRRLFGVSHLLVRMALSQYADRDPARWRFVRNGHGKPRIDPEPGPPGLAFNLSHTAGIALVAVTGGSDVGVDVERTDRSVKAGRLANRFFSPEEAADLEKRSTDRRQGRFFLHWTLKEAAIKALGRGLSVPLSSVGFRLSASRPYRIDFTGKGLPDSGRWRFALLEPRPPYVASVCASADPAQTLVLQARRIGPSGEVMPLAVHTVGLSAGIVCRWE